MSETSMPSRLLSSRRRLPIEIFGDKPLRGRSKQSARRAADAQTAAQATVEETPGEHNSS